MRPTVAALAAGLILAAGCIPPTQRDFHAELGGACDRLHAGGSPQNGILPLDDSCRSALGWMLPFDRDFDQTAPPDFRERVTEAFAVLASYPLALPPEDRLLGTSPWVVPASHVCIFAADAHPDVCPGTPPPSPSDPVARAGRLRVTRNVFNYVMNRVTEIRYGDSSSDNYQAQFGLRPDGRGEITVFRSFVESVDRTAFMRAALLVHEARHGDGHLHVACDDGTRNCDPDLLGAYGLSVTWITTLLHGSAPLVERDLDGRTGYALSDDDVADVWSRACETVRIRIRQISPELRDFLEARSCGLSTGTVLAVEGIQRM